MTRSFRMSVALGVATLLAALPPALAQDTSQQTLARDLAHVMLDDALRRELNDQVTAGLTAALGSTLQERLSRRLLDQEGRPIGGIGRGFVAQALVPRPTGALPAEGYARRFGGNEPPQAPLFPPSAAGRETPP